MYDEFNEIVDNIVNYEPLTQNAEAPILQPLLRDTSPNALRAEEMKANFNKEIGIHFIPDFSINGGR